MKFENMNIEQSIKDSLNNLGFENPTEIQVETIPLIKEGHDVIGQSETGSGKTAAFGIPIVDKVEKGKGIQAIILAPTRELAKQISKDLESYSRLKQLYVQTVYGGVAMMPQVSGLRKADIVVGTPGRMMDHMRRGTIDTRNLKFFVLDEADKMIDMGFIEDIEEIERQVPKERQTLLFSATMSSRLEDIRNRFTNNAKKIKTKNKVSDEVLKQYYCDTDPRSKFSLLVHLINEENPSLSIVFCNTRRTADEICMNLNSNKVDAMALHGGLTQDKRERTLEAFHKGKMRILVATNVAARGLDIKDVSHVFNYNIPQDKEDYANRIGRTARAGKSGKAISLLCREDHEPFRRINRAFSYDVEKLVIKDFKNLPFKRSGPSREGFRRGGFGNRAGNNRFGNSRFGGRRFGSRRF
ncbi:MAG: DEAD/DEAH box helicase [Candidatus Aenigmatarchaeota archaeon]